MNLLLQNSNALIAFIVAVVLVVLQIIFGFLMQKRKEAFRKYHQSLGVLILLVIILSAILFPVISIFSIIVAIPVLAQVIIGLLLAIAEKKGDKRLLKYHRPLGALIFILVIAMLIFIFA